MDKHIICKCGGVIGLYDKRKNSCMCERCEKEYPFHKLKYDMVQINPKTGWIFPMLKE